MTAGLIDVDVNTAGIKKGTYSPNLYLQTLEGRGLQFFGGRERRSWKGFRIFNSAEYDRTKLTVPEKMLINFSLKSFTEKAGERAPRLVTPISKFAVFREEGKRGRKPLKCHYGNLRTEVNAGEDAASTGRLRRYKIKEIKGCLPEGIV